MRWWASLERYAPLAGSWEELPDMPTARSKCAAVVHQGLLYVLGGLDPKQGVVLGSVERFCPKTKMWDVLPSLKAPRASLGAAVVGSQILALGGDSPVVEMLDTD